MLMCSGIHWGWSIQDDSDLTLPYICEIPKADVYKIVRFTRGYGKCSCEYVQILFITYLLLYRTIL